jgi:hypothetical protein
MCMQDIWCHIHSLMPIRDAARVACVSRTFFHSWRCLPNLVFSEETLGLNENARGNNKKSRYFTNIVDCTASVYNKQNRCHLDHLNSWLQSTVKTRIEELHLSLSRRNASYNFPCSVLSDEIGDSIRSLRLASCNFHPTVGLGRI